MSKSATNATQATVGTAAEHSRCPECSGRLNTAGDETYCEKCGLVTETDSLDRGPEWRSFDGDSNGRSRVGAPISVAFHDGGLATQIGYQSSSTGQDYGQLARMRRLHGRAQFETKRDRLRGHALGEIKRLVSALELDTSARDRACSLFREAHDAGLLKGRNMEAFTAASVYAVIRLWQRPWTAEEVAEVARCSTGKVKLGYSLFNQKLGLEAPPQIVPPFVRRYASELDVLPSVQRRAEELARKLTDSPELMGCTPNGIAAACLYMAVQDGPTRRSQAEIADCCNTTSVTLRKNRDKAEEILP